MPRRLRRLTLAAALLAALPAVGAAQDLKTFEKNVTQFQLDNGMTFIVVERHSAPVVSFHTYANVGSVDEVKGITGIAHMFEHMAFKGTTTIGTKDWPKEKAAEDGMDKIYDEIRAERAKGRHSDAEKIARLQEEFTKAQEEADKYIEHDEYEEALTRAGGSGLNASTWYDATQYYISLPSNKVELWMALESQRFLDPVLREFYKEKNVVAEERRMRTENQPFGKLLEEVLTASYKAHPYGEPPIGHMTDINSYTRAEAEKFFDTYYGPGNLTVGIVGDVDPAQVKKMAGLYFGRIPARPAPPIVETVEPEQLGERRIVVEDPTQPLVIITYHKPDITDPDNPVFETISDIMGNGRTSRLYTVLVKEKKIAIAAGGISGIIGNKYPGLFLFYAVPAQGHSAAECEEAILAEIEKLKTEPVTAEELEKSKTRSRASLVRGMQSNMGMAVSLAEHQVLQGDWRTLFTELDDLNRVTAEDVQRVSDEYFKRTNRTVGTLKTAEKPLDAES